MGSWAPAKWHIGVYWNIDWNIVYILYPKHDVEFGKYMIQASIFFKHEVLTEQEAGREMLHMWFSAFHI